MPRLPRSTLAIGLILVLTPAFAQDTPDVAGPRLPPIAATPAPQTAGSRTVTPAICVYDGDPFFGRFFNNAVGQIAVTSDGAVYVIDQHHALRKYTAQPGAACVLRLDPTFGTGGVLATLNPQLTGLHADARGHLFASTMMSGSWRLTGAHVDYACAASRGEVRVTADGRTGFSVAFNHPQRIAFTDAGCTVTPFVYQQPYTTTSEMSPVGTAVYIAGYNGNITQIETRAYDFNGAPRGTAFGRDASFGSNHACYATEVFACASGLCMHDGNCRNFFMLNANGTMSGRAHQHELYGLTYPWTAGIATQRGRPSYATASQQRGPNVYQGFIYRLGGI